MKNLRYRVIYRHGDCHPETCCCDPYRIVDTKSGMEVASFYLKHTANSLADKLNKTKEGFV